MSREASIIQTLVDMADTLVDDFDVVDLLTRLAGGCVDLLGVSAAGVMLAGGSGELRLVASSSETMRVLEMFELQAQQGPCLDAFRTGEAVAQSNLREGGAWPQFTPAALRAGFESVLALPLRLRGTTIGALNMFNLTEALIEDADLVVARALADLAAISVIASRAAAEHQRLNEQLTNALRSRILIEQAKGVISERAGVEVSEAFERLRRWSRHHNLRLTDVAQSAIDGTLDPEAWGPPAPQGAG